MPSPFENSRQPFLAGLVLLGSFVTANGCTVGVEIGKNDEIVREVVLDVPARKRSKLDLLFVVDTSSNMSARQARVTAGFDGLLAAVADVRGEFPDLHVGVISSDLGAGRFAASHSTCSDIGDAGLLQMPQSCSVTDGAFLRLAADGSRNFEGQIADALSCMANLGESGCDYEQPLEALKRALDGTAPANDGFLRPSAMLGIVFVTDEDDCSARVDELFDPNASMLTGDEEWRCFSSGVRCGRADDVTPPGPQTDCVAREDSRYVGGIRDYTRFVQELKSDPTQIFVMSVLGDPSRVEVELSPDSSLGLAPSCRDRSGSDVFPGIRLGHFAQSLSPPGVTQFGDRYTSLCVDDEIDSSILQETSNELRAAMGSTCLRSRVVDVDGDTPGAQLDCRVAQRFSDRVEPVLACDNRFVPTESSFFPCYAIERENDSCSHEATGLSLRVVRSSRPDPAGLDAPIDARIEASCLVDEIPVIVE